MTRGGKRPGAGRKPRPLPTTPDDAHAELVAIGGTGDDVRSVIVTMSTAVGVVAEVRRLRKKKTRKAALAAKEQA